jgi:acetyl/propionyl-CoA carboxylase alpha subunit
VASGEPLPFRQEDVRATGHAVEARVYAEDSRRLLPQAGRILAYREPRGEGVRVDAGIDAGQPVTVHYDPLLAKVITHARSRPDAIAAMAAALAGYDILGVRHNLSFLLALLERDEVKDGRSYTRFIEDHLDALAAPATASLTHAAVAVGAVAAARASAAVGPAVVDGSDEAAAQWDPWDRLGPVTW